MAQEDVLKVESLSVSYPGDGNQPDKSVVKDLSFRIKQSEIVALVGESGSGKTQLALSLIRLLGKTAQFSAKSILLKGDDIYPLSEEALCDIRGNKISMVFQEPMTSLNPVFSIGYQVKEALSSHRNYTKKELKEKALYLLELVRIDHPVRRFDEYPHQISGGMRQRVLIAMALASEPDLLIADEPTTALDVTTQAEILDLLRFLQKETGISILFVTHDLGIVAELCDYVLVMYSGRIVEKGSVKSIFKEPSHPYTKLLLDSVPRLGKKIVFSEPFQRSLIEENISKDTCPFYHRCYQGKKTPCLDSFPKYRELKKEHFSACFFPEGDTGE